ncbi:MAG: Lrp/AsnC family transcriptional regulator [Frankiales bacterium]|nr:Lrp/AsnC family transcriptional regulator [Frankiales bacterium]
MLELDAIDLDILAALVEDGRMSVSALATRVGVARATAYSRVNRLETSGVISGYAAMLDLSKVQTTLSAIVLLNGGQQAWDALGPLLAERPEIEMAYYVTGLADVVLIVRVADVVALRDLLLQRLQALPGIRGTQTLLVIDEVVRPRTALPRL